MGDGTVTPDDDLTFSKLGCRGVLRLCMRAAYYQCCERASVPFLWLYKRSYQALFHLVIRWLPSMWAHKRMYDALGLLDNHCPTWLLKLVSDLAFGSYHRKARLAREVAEKQVQP